MSDDRDRVDRLCIDTVRALSMDAVQAAESGHPGTPMALAPLGFLLWTRHLRHNPENPEWPDRDRFVLSAGHASMLLYSLLHLTGYDLPLEEIRRFRQWDSRTPGHPEHHLTPGVETTTGPLGQGVANSVGLALTERWLARHFNRPGHEIVDHRTYAVCSDGDLMEGISHEAAALAGHLELGKLTWIFDDNRITIEGSTDLATSTDQAARFEGYGWHVRRVDDINDLDALDAALVAAGEEDRRPSLIVVRSTIAEGSPNLAGHHSTHGAPLGEDEVAATKENLGYPSTEPFHVPDEALARWREAVDRGRELEAEWRERLEAYRADHPGLAGTLEAWLAGELPDGWDAGIPAFPDPGPLATRAASGEALNAIARRVPNLIGGSADLAGSNKTIVDGADDLLAETPAGRNMHFGVREHAMGAVLNGMALHGGVRPYGGTFLIFSDYMRPAVRLAALMELPVVYVWTHDSVGLGEDGPTHQPIEQLPSLRAIPGLLDLRPADGPETAEAWRVAMERSDGPAFLALTRQKLPPLDRGELADASGLRRGAYTLADADGGDPELILIASGSEVRVALEARDLLQGWDLRTRVVSMPSWKLFAEQSAEYRDRILPPDVTARLSVEAASTFGWSRWVGSDGDSVGIDRFGASAPGGIVLEKLGFSPEAVAARARALVEEPAPATLGSVSGGTPGHA